MVVVVGDGGLRLSQPLVLWSLRCASNQMGWGAGSVGKVPAAQAGLLSSAT